MMILRLVSLAQDDNLRLDIVRKLSNLTKHPLFAGSFVMIIGSNATNFLNYIYHLIMGRLLGPASYGELATLFSLSGLLGIVPASLSMVIIKYVSSAKSKKDIERIVWWFNQKVLLTSIAIFLLIFILSQIIASFINISNVFLVIIIGSTFLFSLPALLNRSVLQGLLRFKQVVVSVLAENSLKLLLGVGFVYLGFSVGGAVLALLAAAIAGWFITKIAVQDYLRMGRINLEELKPLFLYSIPVLIQSIAMTSLYSTDLILVKHFFPAHDAGIYASLSTLGRIIFFGTGPIGAVMFPLVAQRQAKGGNYRRIFKVSLLLTVVLSLIILLIYWLTPNLAIGILYGSLYLEGVNLLVWFGLLMTLFTLSYLILSYCLSLGRTKSVIFPSIAAVLQIIGIWIYHSNLMQVITISIIVNALLLLTLLIYSSYEDRTNFNNSAGF